MQKTDAIIIMDGFALREDERANAIKAQGIPHLKKLLGEYPHTRLEASGRAVGLPDGQMGNSEVGHLNIGAGRVVYQDITMIDKAIEDGGFFTNAAFCGAVENCKRNDSALHLMGLLSDGGVHSTSGHLYALLKLAAGSGLKKVYVHCITDGRDTPPESGASYINALEKEIKKTGIAHIATVIGRYYIMDRDSRWDRVEEGYNCVISGSGKRYESACEAIEASYKNGITDEFARASVIGGYDGVKDGDSIIFYNFRSDRAREITAAIINKDFDSFKRKGGKRDVFYVGMTQYKAEFTNIHTAFPPKNIVNTLGEYLSKAGKTQARIAETEKYAHVTFFFNGGVEAPNPGEQRILVPSPKVATYDLKPEMSAYEVTEKAFEAIDKGIDVLILNYANCDMVGHTGNFDAAVRAIAVVDECVGKLVRKIIESGGTALVTADHGNAEYMAFEDGSPMTAHTTNPVPFLLAGGKYRGTRLKRGALCDIAPTLLDVMGIGKPEEMEGSSLIEKD